MSPPRAALAILLVLACSTVCDSPQTPVLPVAVGSPPPSATPIAISAEASPPLTQTGTMPNPGLTPGEVFAGVTAAQVCVSGYASRARNVLREQYVQVYASYGIPYPEPAGTYELDHLVPLGLGGDNANRNLWPEPALPVPGFHQKDELENYLHDAVCAGRMQLADVQAGVATNWVALYQRYLRH